MPRRAWRKCPGASMTRAASFTCRPPTKASSGEYLMKAAPIALAAALLAIAAPAAAQNVNDARCILLSNAFAAEAKDAQAQKLAEASLYFYLGRLSPTETTAQLKTVFDQQSKTITETNAGPLM